MLRAAKKASLFLTEFLRDALLYIRYCGVSPFQDVGACRSYKIVIESHAIEKGLALPAPRNLFGRGKLSYIMGAIKRYDFTRSRFPIEMAAGALGAYTRFHGEQNIADPLLVEVDEAIRSLASDRMIAPTGGVRVVPDKIPDGTSAIETRFSCRTFAPYRLLRDEIERIVAMAQRAPSQCNRQATKIYIFQSRSQIDRLLALQAGAAGFAHTVSNLAVISSELVAWGGAQQRNQPYVDGGLFSMAFLLACQDQGYATCPLNLAITHKTENAIRSVAQIPAGERLIMMVAFGTPLRDKPLRAAASPRRPLAEILQIEQT